jgi:hypothetical protein
MFAPAVEEVYDAAARIMDLTVAQQRTVQVVEVRLTRCRSGGGGDRVLKPTALRD